MDNVVTRIQLLGENEGYLDVLDNVTVPINFGISDVRDVGKRTGTFSKTIVLPGTKNNNELLNSYFDINISAGTFNINTVQPCILLQNNIPIVENAYLQLVSVNKLQDTLNEDDFVEYEVVIKDTVGDFFTKLGNRTLEQKDEAGIPYLDFSQFNHTYTAAAVTESFDNTYVDGYKYLLPWINDNDFEYDLSECKPAIYAKQYWDKIHSSTGFSYTWNTLSDPNVQFDKLVIPYNGDDKKLAEELLENYITIVQRGVLGNMTSPVPSTTGGAPPPNSNLIRLQTFYDYVAIINSGRMEIPPIQDPQGNWNQFSLAVGEGFYEVTSDYTQPNSGISVRVSGRYSFNIRNNSAQAAGIFFNGNDPQFSGDEAYPFICIRAIAPDGTVTDYKSEIDTLTDLFPAIIYPGNTTQQIATDFLFNTTIFVPNIVTGTKLFIGSGVEFPNSDFPVGVSFVNTVNPLTNPNLTCTLTISNFQADFIPVINTLLFNFPVELNAFVPKQIKQADFIKSICLMYNLYVQTDPNNANNLIYTHRDDFYDSGAGVDWTEKLDRSREQILNFIPELSSKKLLLTYKQSEDVYNKLYQSTTTEIYGQQEVIFENEYVRDEAKKELIFSPTPMEPTSFGAICPLIPGISPKNNIRILIDNGPRPCLGYNIRNNSTSVITVFQYPLLSHFNQETDPTFDINFGVCDFYFYDIATFTSNNLFNNFWRRTVSQIDQGKLLTAYFMLDEGDISTLKLNDNIRIDNSWWNINRIIDYNANAKIPTKVELVLADTGLKLPRVAKAAFPVTFGRPVDEFIVPTEGMIGLDPLTPTVPFATIQAANNQTSLERYQQLNNYLGNNTGLIIGKYNEISSRFNGVVVGNNNLIPDTPGVYVGSFGLTANGLSKVPNRIGIIGVIDGGLDTVLPYSKTNEADLIDGGEDSVRKFGGGTAGGLIINPRDTSPIGGASIA